MGTSRYWKVHFSSDPATHWVNIDCGRNVSEPMAVAAAQVAFPGRGPVTNAVQDFDRA